MSMQLWRQNQNPLWISYFASCLTFPFWVVSWRDWHGAGIGVIIAAVLFVVLYLRHSYYAWHLAIIMNIGFTTYHLVAGRRPMVDIIVGTILLAYLLVARKPYRENIRARPSQTELDGRI
jgi:hypothetical protein